MKRLSKTLIGGITGLFLMPGTALAAPITNAFTGSVDLFNPGPFTSLVSLSGLITLDDTTFATRPVNTFSDVITGFTLTILEPGGPVIWYE